MNFEKPDNHHVPTPQGMAPSEVGGSSVSTWVDVEGRTWTVTLSPVAIQLHNGTDSHVVPRQTWTRDIFVQQHGARYYIRFENYDFSVHFELEASQAGPFLLNLGRTIAEGAEQLNREPEAVTNKPMLWPKVSTIAVWALFCSAFVFVPILGLIPAIATIVLLIIHRVSVPKRVAYRHSRTMCKVAFCFLALGLVVSATSTLVLLKSKPKILEPFREIESSVAPPSHHALAQSAPLAQFGKFADPNINWGLAILGVIVVVVSLSFHECGHAISAWWLGDDFARQQGRVTLNPLSHIHPVGTVLLPLLFAISGVPGFGFARPVPVLVDHLPRPHRAHILTALAGPAANVLLACASLMLLIGIGSVLSIMFPGAVAENLRGFTFESTVRASGFPLAYYVGPLFTGLKMMFVSNVALAIFNLIPVPPLDGSWVLEHLFPRTFLGRFYARIRPYGFMIFLVLLYSNVLDYVFIYPLGFVLLPGFIMIEFCTTL